MHLNKIKLIITKICLFFPLFSFFKLLPEVNYQSKTGKSLFYSFTQAFNINKMISSKLFFALFIFFIAYSYAQDSSTNSYYFGLPEFSSIFSSYSSIFNNVSPVPSSYYEVTSDFLDGLYSSPASSVYVSVFTVIVGTIVIL